MAKSAARQTMSIKSLILRILWAGCAIGAGRYPTVDDMKSKALLRHMISTADQYLQDVRRIRKG